MTRDFSREAYDQILREPDLDARYPELRARPDWPPRSPERPIDLTESEAREFRRFWQDVAGRSSPETAERPDADVQRREPLDGLEQSGRAVGEGLVQPSAGPDLDFVETSRSAMLQWADLEARLHARMRADGIDPYGSPGWADLTRDLASFRDRLGQIRDLAEMNRLEREYPVPDPQRDPVSPEELLRAEERAIEHAEQPAAAVPMTPHVSDLRSSDNGLAAAQAEIDRQNSREGETIQQIVRDDDLAWLRDVPTSSTRPETTRDEDLDWLRRDREEPEPEIDRDRDR